MFIFSFNLLREVQTRNSSTFDLQSMSLRVDKFRTQCVDRSEPYFEDRRNTPLPNLQLLNPSAPGKLTKFQTPNLLP